MDQFALFIDLAKNWFITYGPNILVALAIFAIGRWLAKWIAHLINKAMARSGMEDTLIRFVDKLVYYTLLVVVMMAAADQIGIKTTSFMAILGTIGLAVGLAVKDSLSNFASGVMLIFFQPFKVGDAITAAGVSGSVERIDLFNSIVNTWDNQKIIIPNSKITSDIITNINANPTRRIDLVIGISYDDDLHEAKNILEQLVSDDNRILTDPAPKIALAEFADSSLNLVVRPWVKTEEYWDVRFDLIDNIKHTFDEKNITIPYPQRDIHTYQHKAE